MNLDGHPTGIKTFARYHHRRKSEPRMSQKKGYFISLEGVEGVGKSTVFQFMKTYLMEQGIDLVTTREPGGTPVAECIRDVLLQHHQEPMALDTEVLLMFASRAQNIATVIEPALNQHRWVLADRYVDASFAYQGGGRQMDMTRLQAIADWTVGSIMPDKTLLLDAPVEVGLERLKERGNKDRIEQETVEFFCRVRDTYLRLAANHPDRYTIIDATQPLIKVQQEVQAWLDALLVGEPT